ncbi:unnamed protein product [Polarella glacialis]|uniref:peptidylprolyl isomerase n=1 Tax=Polarella glacialis TaxID=89957 RepID=A0A813G8J5_POLGL|nr:unnamed protein product [Polarella glacialis]|mmetsp:Transcript_22434/g.36011  ORF Transcript_22434/g.36011 Transcript_22434/m.36011 type:complete len:347 (-) Transcript_22434:161-1201(-)
MPLPRSLALRERRRPTTGGRACLVFAAALALCRTVGVAYLSPVEVETSSCSRRASALRPLLASAASALAGTAVAATPAGAETSLNKPPPDVAAAPADAMVTPSGLKYKVLRAATDASEELRPLAFDKVKVLYTGWRADGKVIDYTMNKPVSFRINQVIRGWGEGVQLMTPGSKMRFWVPAGLGYGDDPKNSKSGQLCFDTELFTVEKGPVPAAIPVDLAQAPEDANRTASGLATKILVPTSLKPGRSPRFEGGVTVDFTGWTSDGQIFESNAVKGKPVDLGYTAVGKGEVCKGFWEGVQLMVTGETRRFWVPPELGFGEAGTAKEPKDGRPGGMLVFDVSLVGCSW